MEPLRRWSGAGLGGRPPRFVLYSHDGQGLGHVSRNLKIAGALTAIEPEASVLLVTGSPMADRLVVPRGVDLLRLPAIRKLGNGSYGSRRLRLAGPDIGALRSAQIAAAIESFRPDVLLADKHPAGVGGELRCALGVLIAGGGRAVVGFRDILDDPAAVRREWLRDRTLEVIHDCFSRVLVYGQPGVLDFASAYGVPARVSSRIVYTGYIAGRPRAGKASSGSPGRSRGESRSRPLVLASAGGGEDGARLLAAFIDAARGAPWQGVVVTGPELEPRARDELRAAAARAGVAIRTFVDDLPAWMRLADAAVCMGGYNTLVDALAYGTPCVCVPRTAPRSEQLIRAEAFARMGLLSMVRPSDLSPAALRREVASAVERGQGGLAPRAGRAIDLDGASKAAGQLLDLATKTRGGDTEGGSAVAPTAAAR